MNIKDSCITPYFYFYSLLSITIATSVNLSDITTDGNFLKTSRRLSILRQRLFQESYTLGPEICLDLWSYPIMLYVILYGRLPFVMNTDSTCFCSKINGNYIRLELLSLFSHLISFFILDGIYTLPSFLETVSQC